MCVQAAALPAAQLLRSVLWLECYRSMLFFTLITQRKISPWKSVADRQQQSKRIQHAEGVVEPSTSGLNSLCKNGSVTTAALSLAVKGGEGLLKHMRRY